MKNKDQVLLEELYNKILSENQNLNVDTKKKIAHDMMNALTPMLFSVDSDVYNEAITTLIQNFKNLLSVDETSYKEVVQSIVDRLNSSLQKN